MMVFAFNVMIIVPGQAAEGVHTEREHDLLHARARDGVRKRIVRWPVVVGCRCPPPLRFVARTGGTTTRNEAPYAHVQFTNCRKKICQTIRAGIYFCRQTTKRGSFAAKLRSGWRTGAHASASWLVASWCAAVALGTEQPWLHTALPASTRAQLMVANMPLDEKVPMLHGRRAARALWVTHTRPVRSSSVSSSVSKYLPGAFGALSGCRGHALPLVVGARH